MKNHTFLTAFILFITVFCSAQERYTVKGESLELTTEAKGSIELLWTITNKQYRYFIKKEDVITELLNIKVDKQYNEEYKTTLKALTSDKQLNIKNINLTLSSLRRFVNDYNLATDANYTPIKEETKLRAQLLVFGGITNNVFVTNPDNVTSPFFGAEIELFTPNKAPNHAAYFNLRYVAEQDDFDYSEIQLALGYRYRFINKSKFNIYGNLSFLTYSYVETTIQLEDSMVTRSLSDGDIDFPFIFGLGADIKLTSKIVITLAYNEIFALFEENSNNFPIDFALGIKFIL